MLHINETTREHVLELRDNLRDGDRREIEGFGWTCARGVWRSYKKSLRTRTALIDGRVAAIWGLGGVYLGGVGQPWLLTTPVSETVPPLVFARVYMQEVGDMLEMFPKLVNYVDAEYTKAIRMLKIAGFSVAPAEPVGSLGRLYRKFEIGV